jgi:hypothetical protein
MCSPKTMIKVAVVAGLVLALGYLLFPGVRSGIVVLAPLAILAICPVSMLIGMAFMNRRGGSGCHAENGKEQG